MSATKVKAIIKEVSDGGTILKLELDSPYYSVLSEGNEVYVRLGSINGHDIDFHEGKPKSAVEETKVEESISEEEVNEPESEISSDEFQPE